MKLLNIAISHFILLLVIILSSIIMSFKPKNDIVVVYSQLLLVVTFFWTFSEQLKLHGFKHLLTFFLGIFFLFLLSLPFFDLIQAIDIQKQYLFVKIKISNEIFYKVYTFSTYFIALMFTGAIFGYVDENELKKRKVELAYDNKLNLAGMVIFLLALPGLLTKYFIQLKVVFQYGYFAVYDGTLDKIKYPIICYGSGMLLVIGYCVFIASKPRKKIFLIITTIFLITQAINVLKGQRAVLMFPLVFSVWYYFKFYAKSISKKNIVFLVLIVAVLSQSIHYFRSNNHIILKKETFVQKYVASFFTGQGVSFFILPYMIHYDLHNDRYPYLLAPLDITSHGKIQNISRLTENNYLADQLMYRMLPQSYNQGGGVGTSLLGVFYDLPAVIAIILCFLLGFLIVKFDAYVKYSRILLLSSFYIVFAVSSSPRYELFQLFYDLMIVWIVFFMVGVLQLIANKTSNKLNKV
ncbi:MAG TPA: O-antigen polysaccharide polymerase Wzy [Paludibacter sp.]|nr:O-antigen polysaccharide polymerase Wzy [Paludibacter sp.]